MKVELLNSAPLFGSWLKQRRKELGLTQPNLAQHVACSVETIDKIEAGKRKPSEQIAERLAEALGVDPSERQLFVEFARARLHNGQPASFVHFTTSTPPELDFRTTLQQVLERGHLETGLDVAMLWRFWFQRGNFQEGREWLESFLSRAEIDEGELDEGPRSDSEGKQLGAPLRAEALFGLGTLTFGQGDFATARSYLEESLTIYRHLGDKQGIANALNNLGNLAAKLGDEKAAYNLYEESLAIRRDLGNYADIACSLHNLGEMARYQGEYVSARRFYEESLAIRRELGHKNSISFLLHNLGHVALHQGDITHAITLFTESLQLAQELGNKQLIAECLAGLGGVAGAKGQPLQAARLLGAADVLLKAISRVLVPADLGEYKRNLASSRAKLDEATWQAAWDEGRTISMEQAIAHALQEIGS